MSKCGVLQSWLRERQYLFYALFFIVVAIVCISMIMDLGQSHNTGSTNVKVVYGCGFAASTVISGLFLHKDLKQIENRQWVGVIACYVYIAAGLLLLVCGGMAANIEGESWNCNWELMQIAGIFITVLPFFFLMADFEITGKHKAIEPKNRPKAKKSNESEPLLGGDQTTVGTLVNDVRNDNASVVVEAEVPRDDAVQTTEDRDSPPEKGYALTAVPAIASTVVPAVPCCVRGKDGNNISKIEYMSANDGLVQSRAESISNKLRRRLMPLLRLITEANMAPTKL